MSRPPISVPSDCYAEEGIVILRGLDTLDVTLTPEAALETSERMFNAALTALGQAALSRRDEERRAAGRISSLPAEAAFHFAAGEKPAEPGPRAGAPINEPVPPKA